MEAIIFSSPDLLSLNFFILIPFSVDLSTSSFESFYLLIFFSLDILLFCYPFFNLSIYLFDCLSLLTRSFLSISFSESFYLPTFISLEFLIFYSFQSFDFSVSFLCLFIPRSFITRFLSFNSFQCRSFFFFL